MPQAGGVAGGVYWLKIDASEFMRIGMRLHNLPDEIRRAALYGAAKRVGQMARTRIVKDVAAMVRVPQKAVRSRTGISADQSGSVAIVIRSKWIPLYELGARQTRAGVTVRLRGSYAHAFLATMKSGHAGVFRRTGAGSPRLPIHEQFGPNPAHAVIRKADNYQQILAEIAEQNMLPRLMHEIDVRLARLNAAG